MHSRLPIIELATVGMSFLFVSCGGGSLTSDLSHLADFVEYNKQSAQVCLSDTVDLYVDYSTCVAEAKYSDYYKALHPSIVDCSPVFYSIKGRNIKKETDNRQHVYQLLSDIREVNNADIKRAVQMIVRNNHQAVLITDGEYYMGGSVRDNLNNPYLAEEFRAWIEKGHDIYFYCEPYTESGRFSKTRFYILFTDDDLANNIHDRIDRSAPKNSRVTKFHMSDGRFGISFSENYPDINVSLSPSENTGRTGGLDVQEYLISWKDMYRYLMGGDIDQTYVLRGLFVDNTESDSYKIEEVKPVVYQISEEYQAYCDSVYMEKMPKVVRKFRKVEVVFEIDDEIFEETGEIVLKLDDDFDGVGNTLSYDHPNLLRVDFVVSEAEDNFSDNSSLNSAFKWQSISAANGHAENTSIYQSISLVLKDPDMNPEKREVVLYTVYLSTMSL